MPEDNSRIGFNRGRSCMQRFRVWVSDHGCGLILLAFSVLLLSSCVFIPPLFEIEEPRMVNCTADSLAVPCTALSRNVFTVNEQVCVAWTEVNRKPQESLAIHIYSSGSRPVFTYSEDTHAGATGHARECRVIRIDRPLLGDLKTNFVIAGRPGPTVGWQVIRPTPSPTPTATSTPTPTRTPTPTVTSTPIPSPTTAAALPFLFEIEQPRMARCTTDSWSAPCQAPPSYVFTVDEQICVAWTEVNRQPREPLVINIHSSTGHPVFAFSEDTYASATGQARECRLIPIDEPLWGGAYETDFVIAGRPGPTAGWQVMGPTPSPTPTATSTPTPQPTGDVFYVYSDADSQNNHFVPFRFFGNTGDIAVIENWSDNPHSGTTAIKVTYGAQSRYRDYWAGVYWSDARGFDLRGFNRLTFWARADTEAIVTFFVYGDPTGRYGRQVADTGRIWTTQEWKQYTIDIDLAYANLSRVTAVGCYFDGADNPFKPLVFYLDDIRFEQ